MSLPRLDRSGRVLAMLASDEGRRDADGDQMARNAGIQGVPSFALQGHVLFFGARPCWAWLDFRRAWEILKERAA